MVFILAVLSIVGWLGFGPVSGYSDTWQLVANTFTTLITFLMGFILLYTQNRDTHAMMLKLDVIIMALAKADNSFIEAQTWTRDRINKERQKLNNASKKSSKR